MEKTFVLDIVTPESTLFSGDVKSVQVPGVQGGFQVLFNHAPIISTLSKGKVKVVTAEGTQEEFDTREGVIEVLNNKAVILVEGLQA